MKFTRVEMKEIRYASLLHDFGKVGVREEVLIKARKLYPGADGGVSSRFDFARRTSAGRERPSGSCRTCWKRAAKSFCGSCRSSTPNWTNN